MYGSFISLLGQTKHRDASTSFEFTTKTVINHSDHWHRNSLLFAKLNRNLWLLGSFRIPTLMYFFATS